jgi:hypothetical protein
MVPAILIVALPRPVVMTAVAIVETAVTVQHVVTIQMMCVARIQVLIAVNLVKPAVRGTVVNKMSIVRTVCVSAMTAGQPQLSKAGFSGARLVTLVLMISVPASIKRGMIIPAVGLLPQEYLVAANATKQNK